MEEEGGGAGPEGYVRVSVGSAWLLQDLQLICIEVRHLSRRLFISGGRWNVHRSIILPDLMDTIPCSKFDSQDVYKDLISDDVNSYASTPVDTCSFQSRVRASLSHTFASLANPTLKYRHTRCPCWLM